ncbi:FAD-dependent monooxygenase [Streptomyces sp. NPDC058657]|uniref:FAD-dependent monooxygenase n=1 Tax=unclassified Streptomyces TaxID=2593676 RepID=UPI003661D5C3
MPLPPLPAAADVVVVGGGPVGMLLAAELALRQVRVVVLERAEQTADEPRAGTLHARTAQSLARRGVLPGGPLGVTAQERTSTAFHFAGMPGLTINAPASEGAPVVGMPQAQIERYFEARTRDLGGTVVRGATVREVRPGDESVEVELADGSTVTAGWVVGCDGARSTVRTWAGISSTEHPATCAALVGMVRLSDPARALPGWHQTPRGWVMMNVNPFGVSRVLTFDFAARHEDRRAPVTLAELGETTARIAGHPVPMTDLGPAGRFSDFARLADTYRSGRVLLAGDAAHVHFPVGGQGLNLGLQDAFNLGWKLSAVLRDGAPEKLLDTYTQERRPTARRAIENTRIQATLMDPSSRFDPLRTHYRELLTLPEANRRIGDMISGQDVAYGHGFAQDRALGGVHTGLRLSDLLAGGRAVLLDEAQGASAAAEAAAAWSDRLESTIGAALSHPRPCVRLIRPDGYIAWSSPSHAVRADELQDVLGRLLGPRRQRASTVAGPGPQAAGHRTATASPRGR